MTLSAAQFAREFEQLKSRLAEVRAPHYGLLQLKEFWPKLLEKDGQPSYYCYFQEFYSVLNSIVNRSALHDLTISDLNYLVNIYSYLNNLDLWDDLGIMGMRLVHRRLAELYFYVGETQNALDALQALVKHDIEISPQPYDVPLPEIERLRSICEIVRCKNPDLYKVLLEILLKWEEAQVSVKHDLAYSLFVERDCRGSSIRGHLRELHGTVEIFSRTAKKDEVTFESVYVRPDDPFLGVAYDALKAVRKVFESIKKKSNPVGFYHTHFTIANSEESFSGDSIGLSIAMLSYIELLGTQVSLQDKYLSAEVAFSGGIDVDGRITPANDETIGIKVDRAFFSPLKYLVIPKANLKSAATKLDELGKIYLRRHLHIKPVEHLTEVLEDRNIIRSEKVCLGKYIVKKPLQYLRIPAIRLPFLLMATVLAYLLLCQIYPRAWIFFDSNPSHLVLNSNANGYIVMNSGNEKLWDIDFQDHSISSDKTYYDIANLDSDNELELALIPFSEELHRDTMDLDTVAANLYVFDDNGDFLLRRCAIIPNQYPGDTTYDQLYRPGDIRVIEVDGQPMIVTMVSRSGPYRAHIRFWSHSGDSLGWYINQGSCRLHYCGDINGDGASEIVFAGNNNRDSCGALFILPVRNIEGVSPPYEDLYYDLTRVKRGNQLAYMGFPPTDLNRISTSAYNAAEHFYKDSEGTFQVITDERFTDKPMACGIIYYLNSSLRIFKASADDYFKRMRRQAIDSSLINNIPDQEYYVKLVDSVLYWKGGRWISEGQLREIEKK
ncbi:MAG TPA: hypothetical protein ENO22_07310 [candidate division Zixibacteria bacterium]|nr:hypothetical protein [candidate division Zixibacteria bacterium]